VGIGDDDIRTISVAAAGNVWAGPRGAGAERYDGSVWKPFGFLEGLIFDRTLSSAADPTGPPWIGTEFGISEYLGPIPGAPGSVPDGAAIPGTPLTVSKGPGPGKLTIAWGLGCGTDVTDYAVYRGALGDFGGHVPLTCSTNNRLSHTFTPQVGDAFFLVMALNGVLGVEGGYGVASAGERAPSAAPCQPQPLRSICP
jgi:hypothetical protein